MDNEPQDQQPQELPPWMRPDGKEPIPPEVLSHYAAMASELAVRTLPPHFRPSLDQKGHLIQPAMIYRVAADMFATQYLLCAQIDACTEMIARLQTGGDKEKLRQFDVEFTRVKLAKFNELCQNFTEQLQAQSGLMVPEGTEVGPRTTTTGTGRGEKPS